MSEQTPNDRSGRDDGGHQVPSPDGPAPPSGTGGQYPYGDVGQHPDDGEPSPYAQPQYNEPQYEQQPQYGQPQYGDPQYGQQGYGAGYQQVAQYPPGYGGYAPTGPPTPASTIVLLIISGLTIFTGIFVLVGLPALIIGIVAITKNRTAPEETRKLTRIGWITYAAVAALHLLGFLGLLATLL